jgi:phenylalanyl-tRNA synthetase beta chain
MKISYNWLKELINIDKSIIELEETLTMLGFEVEDVIDYGKKYSNFVIANVVKKESHPNADKLNLCTVKYGDNEQIVVCGAPNVDAGQNIVLGLSGAIVPKGEFKLTKAVIRGVESNGMICSKAELELGEDHSGIWVLPEDAPNGESLSNYLGLNDVIFDIFITPNRADGNSHIGIARELAAYYNLELNLPKIEYNTFNNDKSEFEIKIENEINCPRYLGMIIKNVKILESPDWLKNRLKQLGLRPRNIAVDATNYVLMETGNPLHAFDLDTIANKTIVVKNAADKEQFISLDSKERNLDSNMLMICDSQKPIAIAGVMGGENSEITDNTKNILIESAYFNPSSVRKTARKLSIHSDASYRFERGVDYDNLLFAAQRAAMLITKYGGGEVGINYKDIYPTNIEKKQVILRYERCRKIIGLELTSDEINNVFYKLKWEYETFDEYIKVTSPSYRVDIKIEEDLIEEVARFINYNNIKPNYRSIVDHSKSKVPNLLEKPIKRDYIRNYLINKGFNEILTPNQISEEVTSLFDSNAVKIANPLGVELGVMRTSIIPSTLKVVSKNINFRNLDLQLFQIGKCFKSINETTNFIDNISEQDYLNIVLTGNMYQKNWSHNKSKADFYDLKGIFEDFNNKFELNLKLKENKDFSIFSADSLSIYDKKDEIGKIGFISKQIIEKFEIENQILLIDLNLSKIYSKEETENKYSKVSPYPSVDWDLAFLVNENLEAGKILNDIDNIAGKYLINLNLFDVYQGKNIEEGKKSLAFNLKFSTKDRTLTDEDINPIINKIIKMIADKHNGQLRDS